MQYPVSVSFNKGLREIPLGKIKEVQNRLKEALGVWSHVGWKRRRDGAVEPRISECMKIEAIFAEYGVTDPWGE